MNEIHIYLPAGVNIDLRFKHEHKKIAYQTKEEYYNTIKIPNIIKFLGANDSPIDQQSRQLGGIYVFQGKESKRSILVTPTNYKKTDIEAYTDAESQLRFKIAKTVIFNIPKKIFKTKYQEFKENKIITEIKELVSYLTNSRVPYIMVWDDTNGARFVAGNNKDDKVFLNYKHNQVSPLVQELRKTKAEAKGIPYEQVVASDTILNLYSSVCSQ